MGTNQKGGLMMGKIKQKSFLCFILMILLIGCISDKNTNHYARTIYKLEDMPEIVFLCFSEDSEIVKEEDAAYKIIFYDNKGNIYFSDDPEVCLAGYKNMIKALPEGKYDEKITLIGTCKVNELFKNYRKLCKISRVENYEVIYPMEVGFDFGPEMQWAGIYYSKGGELEYLTLHERADGGDYETNDERATEIYEWFEENISTDVE